MTPARPARRLAMVVGVVGAESTGKTELAHRLAQVFARDGIAVARVDEHLRAFCERHGRTPTRDEQPQIADRQTARIAEAAASHALVFADTTALMTAVYSDVVFGDLSLYASAQAAHRRCDLTLLTGLDLPWVPDGLQRDGPQVRGPVDSRVRAALDRAGVAYAVVRGQGEARTDVATAAVRRAWQLHLDADLQLQPPWQWHCDRCGDAACERHALLPPNLS